MQTKNITTDVTPLAGALMNATAHLELALRFAERDGNVPEQIRLLTVLSLLPLTIDHLGELYAGDWFGEIVNVGTWEEPSGIDDTVTICQACDGPAHRLGCPLEKLDKLTKKYIGGWE